MDEMKSQSTKDYENYYNINQYTPGGPDDGAGSPQKKIFEEDKHEDIYVEEYQADEVTEELTPESVIDMFICYKL